MANCHIKFFTLSLAAVLYCGSNVQADIIESVQDGKVVKVLVSDDSWQPDAFKGGLGIPAAYVVDPQITVDGIDNEPAWSAAEEINVPLSFGTVKFAQMKALYSDEFVHIRVRWPDASEDRLHRPWTWNETLGNYETGPQVEDALMLSFEIGCEWFPSFLSGYDFDFDGWRWMAGRTDPTGYALDMFGQVKESEPSEETAFVSRYTEDEWNMRFSDVFRDAIDENREHLAWDEMDRKYELWPINSHVFINAKLDGNEKMQLARELAPPTPLPASPAPMLPQFEPFSPQKNTNDVRAKGRWEDGFWTVEFSRKRITGHKLSYDVPFERLTQFSLHVFDRVERMDQSSESPRLFLQFLDKNEPLRVGR
jgi:hypothetical protein